MTQKAFRHVLGIESSCDEMAAAVVRSGREILASVIHDQADVHRPYKGVVPELASRDHIRAVSRVADRALRESGLGLADLDGVAVTAGPGLVGSLLVGLSFGKAVAYRQGIPVVGVHHLVGHLMSAELAEPDLAFVDVDDVALVSASGAGREPMSIDALTLTPMGGDGQAGVTGLPVTGLPVTGLPVTGLAVTSLDRILVSSLRVAAGAASIGARSWGAGVSGSFCAWDSRQDRSCCRINASSRVSARVRAAASSAAARVSATSETATAVPR